MTALVVPRHGLSERDRGLLTEFVQRQELRERIVGAAFPAQRRWIADRARRKAALCTRRAGKTMAAGLALYLAAFMEPRSRNVFLTLTRQRSKDILWDELKEWNRSLALGVPLSGFNETELLIRLPNHSMIKLSGADADDREREKVLGQPYALAVIDECASFRSDLRKLVNSHLGPAMADRRGTIALIGAPGDFIGPPDRRHMFYSVTMGEEPGWARESVHRWSAYDNPYVATQWAEEVADIEKHRPLFRETPEYRMMYLGEWAIDEKRRVYRFDDARNLVDAAPVDVAVRVVGVDLGFNDDSAFTLSGWAPHDKTLYLQQSYKHRGWIVSQVAEELRRILDEHPEAKLVIDGANKQAVEEMRRRYELPLIAAAKPGKADFIRTMNSDLIEARIKLVRGACDQLIEEWATLVWDERAHVPREKEACPNHCADSALYAWRYARPFLEPPKAELSPHPSTEAWMMEMWARRGREQQAEGAE